MSSPGVMPAIVAVSYAASMRRSSYRRRRAFRARLFALIPSHGVLTPVIPLLVPKALG